MNNLELIETLKSAVRREREATADVLRLLREVEKRQLFLEQGHSSLFVFCQRELGYSEPEAFLRIQAMRLMRDLPEVEEKIEAGELSLSVAAKIQSASKELPRARTEALVEELSGASKREAEAKIEALLSEVERPEKARAVSEDRVEICFTVTKEEMELFQKLLDRKAHSNFERKFKTLFVALAKEELNKIEKPNAPFLVPDKVRGRHIPAATRRLIWKRDKARCQFVSPTGQR